MGSSLEAGDAKSTYSKYSARQDYIHDSLVNMFAAVIFLVPFWGLPGEARGSSGPVVFSSHQPRGFCHAAMIVGVIKII